MTEEGTCEEQAVPSPSKNAPPRPPPRGNSRSGRVCLAQHDELGFTSGTGRKALWMEEAGGSLVRQDTEILLAGALQ
jgi:hypothetical protein